jgi:putative hydroxymethylpyrimidine transport system substrate-binding protein
VTGHSGPFLAVLAVATCLAAMAGCGEREAAVEPRGPVELDLLLDFFPNADHAPIYSAEAAGHFRELGLDVQIRQPTDPAAPIREVAAGRADLAISYEPEVLRARAEGLPVVSVGALVQRPLSSIISLPEARIARPADLEGKRVGTAGIDYQDAFLDAILERAGVDPASVERQDVGFNLSPALLSGQVDAVLGAFWNYEGTDLRLRGREPRIIRVEQAGIPEYDELVIVANERTLEEDPGLLRSFMSALSRGARDLRADPQRGLDALLEANPDLDPRLQRAVVEVTLPLFFPPEGKPYGWQDPRQWDRFATFLERRGVLTRPVKADEALTNELLPGEGL